MLGDADLMAFVSTTDLARARAFYESALGLTHLEDNPVASVFDAHGTTLRVTLVEVLAAAPFTVLGWQVADMGASIDALTGHGVTFERFEGMGQDEKGVWTTPGGDLVAWFRDPDGNLLSLTQFR
jgi:catechol 2,3-dioxygenase-like lactoylglutathione lyase family enzyme